VTLVKSDGDPSAQEREGSRRSEAKADHVLVGNGIGIIFGGKSKENLAITPTSRW
jgi:hypothetical protein